MEKQLLQTCKLSQLFESITEHSPQKYFYCGYLYSKYELTLSSDFKAVLDVLDRLNKLFITSKQKNTILQKLSAHRVDVPTLQQMEKTVFEYVDEVVPHLQLAVQLEKTRKESQTLSEMEILKAVRNDAEKEGEDYEQMECAICLLPMSLVNKAVLECKHVFHTQCVSKTFEVKIDSNIMPLVCPQDECNKEATSKDIIENISKQYRQKLETFLFKKYVDSNYETMCWCPTIGCQYVFCFEIGESTFHCPSCSKFYCLKCRSQYHIGMSCREYSRSKDIPEDDQKFYQFAEGARYKQCPRCKFWVEKSEGCHHMVCRCQFQFCYTCGEEYPNCACNTEEQTQRAELALQVAAEQLRMIQEGLREHQRELQRLQRLEEIESPREFRSPFLEINANHNSIGDVNQQRQKQIQQLLGSQEQISFKPDQQPKPFKNVLSTSIGSDDKQSDPKHEFQLKRQQYNRTLISNTFHRSPQARKIFKPSIYTETGARSRYPNHPNKSLKSERLDSEKPLQSLDKSTKTRLDRPMYYQVSAIQKLSFSDMNERKKSQTKY